ncbi:hypothetical protein HBA55_29730 [Pseudomaricurvus alkylphenolicus]|uniref:hypothetical protein n=1 Tax=Pseudomaricurvus alkylphenolicus TaxID=1306991 RepID=UPI001422AD5A|nr:hypothetical protein [Pseudomaricurvus alkylphenolicus]NIB43820.1 hypothetical protein [Pseudomaricurvus alkylphenolicus]
MGLLNPQAPGAPKPVSVNIPDYNVSKNSTVQHQMNNILNEDSPLMKTSRSQGERTAQSRGLLNTNIAAQTSMGEMIRNAMPMAQQDAGTYASFDATKYKAQLDNVFNIQDFRHNIARDNNSAINDRTTGLLLQRDQNEFTASQNDLNREHQSTEAALGRSHELDLQGNDTANEIRLQEMRGDQAMEQQESQNRFTATENQANRAHEGGLLTRTQAFEGSENARNRAHDQALQQGSQQHQATQSALDRAQQAQLAGEERALTREQAALDRQQQLGITDREIAARLNLSEQEYQQQSQLAEQNNRFQAAQQEVINAHQAQQSGLDRTLQRDLSDDEIAARLELSREEYQNQRGLAEQSDGFQTARDQVLQTFEAEQTRLGREHESRIQSTELAHQSAERAEDRQFEARESLAGREHERSLQEQDQTFRSREADADRAFQADENLAGREHETTLQQQDQTFRSGEAEADRAFQSAENLAGREHDRGMQGDEFAFRSGESEADRAFDREQNEQDRTFEAERQEDQQAWESGTRWAELQHEAAAGAAQRAHESEQSQLEREAQRQDTIDTQLAGMFATQQGARADIASADLKISTKNQMLDDLDRQFVNDLAAWSDLLNIEIDEGFMDNYGPQTPQFSPGLLTQSQVNAAMGA